jgi:hypothetical protein
MGISRRDGDFIMSLISIILFLAFQRSNEPMEARHLDVMAQMPLNIRAALSKFDLDSRLVIYAVCPTCHCTYKPRYDEGSTYPIYEEFCTNRPKPESDICGEPLLRRFNDEDGHRVMKPIKPFAYHDFHDYLASLLSRADLEGAMDKSCDDLLQTLDIPAPEHVGDVWEAEFLRTFEGPLPGKVFIDRQGEGRYGFTLNIDFFNIEGMRTRGRTTSCGLISMACLNLPYEIRYKPENMYVAGLIPPPHQPSTTELNHYAKPVIDALVESWDTGVRYSRTALHPNGKTTRSAVIAAVMDLPAARHASQLASHSSHFYCSACQCFHRSTMGRIDHERWVMRDVAAMRRNAEKWLHASTSKERDEIFKQHGTRWSEFWRLRYWDPTRQLVVDAMHCMLEGHAEHHFRTVLGLTSLSAASELIPENAFSHNFTHIDHNESPNGMTLKEVKQVDAIHALLIASLDGIGNDDQVTDQESFNSSLASLSKRLSSKNIKPLQFVCDDLGCHPIPPVVANRPDIRHRRLFKKDWVGALVQWVSFNPLPCHTV